MIRHVSIPARDPAHVATVLAELIGGHAYPFRGGSLQGAFMAVAGDASGHTIEVYPQTVMGVPGGNGEAVDYIENPNVPTYYPFHVLIATPLTAAQIVSIGQREGWRTQYFGRGIPGGPSFFHLFEFWVENNFLFELMPETATADYERTFQFDFLETAGLAPLHSAQSALGQDRGGAPAASARAAMPNPEGPAHKRA